MKYTELPTTGAYIVFVRSKGILARAINLGMSLFQVLRLKQYPEKNFNHTAFLVNGWVTEALGRGITTRSIKEVYGGKNKELKVFKVSDKREGLINLRNYVQKESDKKYDFINFWNHAVRIFTGKWNGKTKDDAKGRLYCIEFCANGLNEIYGNFIDEAWKINPYEMLQICDHNFDEMI